MTNFTLKLLMLPNLVIFPKSYNVENSMKRLHATTFHDKLI